MPEKKEFLPTTLKEAGAVGISEFDVIIVSADAYVDHPSFGLALIGRYLQSLGLEVGIIPQPSTENIKDFSCLGRPRLFFGVTAGNLDSMVSLYTAQRKIRSEDPYSEKGSGFRRPYLPTIVYTNMLKQAFKGVPVVIGGIEASLRRFAHYDFYQDKVRLSILLDSKADLLIYGNGEAPLKELVDRLRNGDGIGNIRDIKGTAIPVKESEKGLLSPSLKLPSYESVRSDKSAFSKMTQIICKNTNPYNALPLYQEAGTRAVLVNPPAMPLDTKELDSIYSLPFARDIHPRYKNEVPAFEVTRYSLTTHRGCYGGCSFCALCLHQGKFIQSRSSGALIKEVLAISAGGKKKVVIKDAGGPTANMYGTFCSDSKAQKNCLRRSCLSPNICGHLNTSSKKYEAVLKDIINMQEVQNLYINTGVRYDLALLNPSFIDILAKMYTMGHLSAAPEHCSEKTLKIMNKPSVKKYLAFADAYNRRSRKYGKKQFLMPYFIIGHPGSDKSTEKELAVFVKKHGITMNQIQEFYPTPLTASTSMYYTGMDPFTGEKIFSEKKLGIKKRWKETIISANRYPNSPSHIGLKSLKGAKPERSN